MRLAIVLALVSSLQIFQQGSVDGERLSTLEFALVSAAFPIGKFLSTLVLSLLTTVNLHAMLDNCAKLLILGAGISALPMSRVVAPTLGRILMGVGAGAGFVCAPVVLRLSVPSRLRPANFLFLAAAFSIGTFLANCLPLFSNVANPALLSAMFSALSGIAYLTLRPDEYMDCATEDILDEHDELEAVRSPNPALFVFLLMVINVTYSKALFTHFGVPDAMCSALSIAFPLAQLVPIFFSTLFTNKRRVLVLGGYYLTLTVQFFLLITSSYPFLPQKHKEIAMSVFLFAMPVLFSVPCNTALCNLCEQFDSTDVRLSSKSRCFMWLLSAFSTLTFGPSLEKFGFTTAFAPYFATSVACFLALLFVFPAKQPFAIRI